MCSWFRPQVFPWFNRINWFSGINPWFNRIILLSGINPWFSHHLKWLKQDNRQADQTGSDMDIVPGSRHVQIHGEFSKGTWSADQRSGGTIPPPETNEARS